MERKTRIASYEEAVVERRVLDVLDLSPYPADAFDSVVCYGGPLSYVLERADDAVAELARVTRPGGVVLCSVMSLLGSMRSNLAGVFALVEQFGLEAIEREVKTGDIAAETARGQAMRLYRWAGFKELLERHQLEVVAATAANYLSVGQDELLARVAADKRLWSTFLEWEISACEQQGALDGGTHMVAAARKVA